MKKNHNQVQQSKKKTDYIRLTLKKKSQGRKMNSQLRVSFKIKRVSSLVVHACSPVDQEFKDSLSYMRPFIKKKRSRRRNVHLIRIPSQGQTGPTVPCLLQHFLKKEEILKWGMKWEQEHPQGQEAETLRGPNFIKAVVLPLSAMYTTCTQQGRTCRMGRIPQGQAGHGSVCCGETLLAHEETLF